MLRHRSDLRTCCRPASRHSGVLVLHQTFRTLARTTTIERDDPIARIRRRCLIIVLIHKIGGSRDTGGNLSPTGKLILPFLGCDPFIPHSLDRLVMTGQQLHKVIGWI